MADDALDLLERGVVGREPGLELGAQAREALEHHAQVEGALAREVAVEGALADATGLGDPVHLHLVVVLPGEGGLGGAQDAVAQAGDRWAAATAGGEPEGVRGRGHLNY